jgi:hypothetical protein
MYDKINKENKTIAHIPKMFNFHFSSGVSKEPENPHNPRVSSTVASPFTPTEILFINPSAAKIKAAIPNIYVEILSMLFVFF